MLVFDRLLDGAVRAKIKWLGTAASMIKLTFEILFCCLDHTAYDELRIRALIGSPHKFKTSLKEPKTLANRFGW